MARKTFFSFHCERDAWRAANVRNSGVLSSDRVRVYRCGGLGKIEREGDAAIKRRIEDQLVETSQSRSGGKNLFEGCHLGGPLLRRELIEIDLPPLDGGQVGCAGLQREI